jgi:hypothetical protein
VAYSYYNRKFTAAPTRNSMDIMNDIDVINSWPNSQQVKVEKTPSVIAYDTSPPTWGHEASLRHESKITHFKLGLTENVGKDYGPGILSLHRSNENDGNHRSFHSQKESVKYTTDFLACLFDFVTQKVLQAKFGAEFLRSLTTTYILTVPQIWEQQALANIRLAASRAFKVSQDQLILLAETEAAAHYCASIYREELEEGNRILICDAGRGTVVLRTFDESNFRTSSRTKLCPSLRSG